MGTLFLSLIFVVVLNLLVTYFIYRDDVYFLDEEKSSYVTIVWVLPLIGALLGMYRLHADKTFYMMVMALYFLLRIGFYALFYMQM